MRTCIFSILFSLNLVVLCYSPSEATRRKREKPPNEKIEIINQTLSIVPFLKSGFFTGEVTKYIKNNENVVYGGGLRLERFIGSVVRVDVGAEALYGKFAEDDEAKGRGLSLSTGSCIMFYTQQAFKPLREVRSELPSSKPLNLRSTHGRMRSSVSV